MSFNAGSILSTLGLDVSPFAGGMLEAGAIASIFPQTVQNFLANPLLGLIGIASDAASAIAGAVAQVGAAADNAGEAAQKVGVSTEFLTGLGFVFADAGSSAEGLADALKFVNKNASEAAGGSKTAIAAFEAIGISADFVNANLGNTEALFNATVDGINGLGTSAQKTDAAMALLGRGGADALAAISMGSKGLADQVDIYKQLGAVTDSELAAAGDKWGTLNTIIDAAWQGIQNALARPILKFVQDNFDEIVATVIDAAGAVREWAGTFTSLLVPALRLVLDVLQPIVALWKALANVFSANPVLFAASPALAVGAYATGLTGPGSNGQPEDRNSRGSSGLSQVINEVNRESAATAASVTPLSQGMQDVAAAARDARSQLTTFATSIQSVDTSSASAADSTSSQASAQGNTGGGGLVIQSLNIPQIDWSQATASIAEQIVKPIKDEYDRQINAIDSRMYRDNGGLV